MTWAKINEILLRKKSDRDIIHSSFKHTHLAISVVPTPCNYNTPQRFLVVFFDLIFYISPDSSINYEGGKKRLRLKGRV